MPRKKKKTTRSLPKASPKSGVSAWFGRDRESRLARLEERDWRRRIILASRKLQMVQLALSADSSDVRGLRESLKRAQPGVERLGQELERSRGVAGSLERKLGEHAELLRKALEQKQTQAPSPGVHESKLRELEQELERVQTQLGQAREQHAQETAALQAEKDALSRGNVDAAAESAKRTALEAALSQGARRATELESLLRQSEEQRALQEAQRVEEVQDLCMVTEARIRELEAELVHKQIASIPSEDSERGAKRVAELELEVGGLQSVRSDLEQAHAEIAGLQKTSTQRLRQLEARVQAAEDERARMLLEYEREFEQQRSVSEARIKELEAKLAHLSGLEKNEEADRKELEQATARFEARVAELEGRIRVLNDGRENLQRDHGRELAENAARILELEAFNEELEKTLREIEARSDEGAQKAVELESRVRELEDEKAQLEENYAREVSALSTAHQIELRELEAELQVLRRERDGQDEQLTQELAQTKDSHERILTALRGRLRQSEMARIEIETRHTTSMSDFADHTRTRIVKLEKRISEKEDGIRELIEKVRTKDSALEVVQSVLKEVQSVLREKERELEEVKHQLAQQERANVELGHASDELHRLQEDLQYSGERLEEQTSRLIDLMQSVDEGEA